MLHTRAIGQEFRPMLRLAAPLALTELGWLAMAFVDTVMVGRLPDSATAIGAVSLGSTLFYTIGIFGSGTMLGLDTLVAQAYGARRLEECHRTMWNSLYFACALSPLLMAAMLAVVPLFGRFGLAPELVAQTVPFLKALVWSTLPLALYFALRRYLQSMHIVKPVVFALISANLVNLHLQDLHGRGAGCGRDLLQSQTQQRIIAGLTAAEAMAHPRTASPEIA